MPDEDRVRILHMMEAAEAVARFLAGRNRADLDRDQMLLFAIVRAIEKRSLLSYLLYTHC